MQYIRKRPRLDTLLNQQRASNAAWGRWLYLVLLAGLALALVNHFLGAAIMLRADGILLTDRQIVAATYPAKVVAVHVKEGDAVTAGKVLIELESADMLKDIADLAARNADLAVRQAELRGRVATVAALLPLAERNGRESKDAIARMDSLSDRSLVPTRIITQALAAGYDTAAKLAELHAQSDMLSQQLSLVEQTHTRASSALAQLEAFYDRGSVRANDSGVVGSRVPSVGQVAKFGDELLQVYGAKAYVLAYLPDIYLFAVRPGDRVEVTGGAGSRTVPGVVDAILDVADALPPEFQNMFRPRDRSRLVRISLPKDHGFAISQKVEIGGCIFGWCWTATPMKSN
jgi:multidrug resistance efflux pump